MFDPSNVDIEHYAKSGFAITALRKELVQRLMTEDEIIAFVEEAERKNVYGFDYKTDRAGNPQQQGIGSRGHESHNHYASIRRYEGEQAYLRAVKEIYKRDPQRAKAIGLPEPERIG